MIWIVFLLCFSLAVCDEPNQTEDQLIFTQMVCTKLHHKSHVKVLDNELDIIILIDFASR